MASKNFNFVCLYCGEQRTGLILFDREKNKMIRCSCNMQTTLTREDILDFLKIKKKVRNRAKVLDIYRYELALNYSEPILVSDFMFKT